MYTMDLYPQNHFLLKKKIMKFIGLSLDKALEAFAGTYKLLWSSQVVLAEKTSSTNAGDSKDLSSIPGLGRSPGGGYGNPLQYSCLENPMDRGAIKLRRVRHD